MTLNSAQKAILVLRAKDIGFENVVQKYSKIFKLARRDILIVLKQSGIIDPDKEARRIRKERAKRLAVKSESFYSRFREVRGILDELKLV